MTAERGEEKKKRRAAIYIRLSREDGDKEESDSVVNQRELIRAFLQERPEIEVCSERVDDGYSGVTFERPAVQEMFADIRAGRIDCVVVKDLSRFGRNYIETGRYIEQIFPILGVRFLAINDGYDSEEGTDFLLLPFKNLLNDAYSRDISLKVRSQIRVRYLRGDHIGSFAPYGYGRSPQEPHKLCVDERAAGIVRDIFKRRLQGDSCAQIARRLNEKGIPSPLEYKKLQGWAYYTPFQRKDMTVWCAQSVSRILNNEIYIGTMVQGRERTYSYKMKKKFRVPEQEWKKVENTHEPILLKREFETVRRLIGRDTRLAPGGGKPYPLSGLLYCPFCGRGMVRRSAHAAGKTYVYYVCRTRKENGKSCPQGGRIREALLLGAVEELQRLAEVLWGQRAADRPAARNVSGGGRQRAFFFYLMERIEIQDRCHIRIYFTFRLK